jgi:hypothetical protein
MKELFPEYQKYRWFYTSNNVLVIGGKSAEQNEELLRKVKSSGKEFVIMHTSAPGSPFAVILEDVNSIKKQDLEETAVFTACFSRAWREKRDKSKVDIFLASSLFKSKEMSLGTWGVKETIGKKDAGLKLALTKQKDKLRAVPINPLLKKNHLVIIPGDLDKKILFPKIQIELDIPLKEEELISALPSGGLSIVHEKVKKD